MNVESIHSLQPLSPPAGYVYVVRDVEISGIYKIGYTGHPATRFAKFDNELPFRIEPVLILKIDGDGDAKEFEQGLHRRYLKLKKFGEWFRLNDHHIGQLREQSQKLIVFAARSQFRSARAQRKPREIKYTPPDVYQEFPKLTGSGYVYVIQDEEYTKLFRVLWTDDPEKINRFSVFIPFRTKVVLIEPGAREKADELNRRYATNRLVGKWLDLNDEQFREIHDSLLPPPATPYRQLPSWAKTPAPPAPSTSLESPIPPPAPTPDTTASTDSNTAAPKPNGTLSACRLYCHYWAGGCHRIGKQHVAYTTAATGIPNGNRRLPHPSRLTLPRTRYVIQANMCPVQVAISYAEVYRTISSLSVADTASMNIWTIEMGMAPLVNRL